MFELDVSLEPVVRLSIFVGVLCVMIGLEFIIPRRDKQFRLARWPANLGLVALNTIISRLILPGATVLVAVWAAERDLGLLNIIKLPGAVSMLLAVVALDMVTYWQHRLSHMIPIFWRVHRLHHADTMIDVTTGARFHPIEIILSVLLKLIAIIALGASAWAVIVFEVVLNAMAMFNHGNIRLPRNIDRIIRYLFVTPDMHRVHHSIYPQEHHQNYGFNLSIWDRWFKSYVDQPKDGHTQMQIGLPYFREQQESSIMKMVTQPFREPSKTPAA